MQTLFDSSAGEDVLQYSVPQPPKPTKKGLRSELILGLKAEADRNKRLTVNGLSVGQETQAATSRLFGLFGLKLFGGPNDPEHTWAAQI